MNPILDPLRRRALSGRERLSSTLLRGFFGGLSRAGRLNPLAHPAAHGVERIEGLPYVLDGTRAHLLDVYRPKVRHGPLPLCLYLHGGAFQMLDKNTHWIMGLIFARRGFVCVVPSYRLAPRHPFPAALEDACDALRWTLDNAAMLHADPERLVLAGESAGANLAAGLTLGGCLRSDAPLARRIKALGARPRATLPLCGVLQVSEINRLLKHQRPHWVVRDELVQMSRNYLPDPENLAQGERDLVDVLPALERGPELDHPLPPFFASVGGADPLVDDTARLQRALDVLGVRCETHFYPGELHAFQALVWRRAARESWQRCFDFLEEMLS